MHTALLRILCKQTDPETFEYLVRITLSITNVVSALPNLRKHRKDNMIFLSRFIGITKGYFQWLKFSPKLTIDAPYQRKPWEKIEILKKVSLVLDQPNFHFINKIKIGTKLTIPSECNSAVAISTTQHFRLVP